MKAGEVKILIQALLGIPPEKRFPNIGPLTRARFEELASTHNEEEWAPDVRHINQATIDLIKHFEGRRLVAYKDPVGVWTIGYGHTGLKHQDGTVYSGRTITEQQAEDLLRYDLGEFANRVKSLVKVPLGDNQFGALVSFDFNTGGLHKSTLLKILNAGDYSGAANELLKWNKAGGTALAGLTRRRKSERRLFLSQEPYIVEV